MLSNNELSTFCSQMALLLHSGISSMEAVSIMKEDAATPKAEQILSTIYDGLENQLELSDALKETGLFPKYVLDMVTIGNSSGRLDDVMAALSKYYEREERISQDIKNAVTYPLIMTAMLFVVTAVLIVKVLPVFDDVFKQLGGGLTGPARALMTLGTGSGIYLIGFFVLVFLIACILVHRMKSSVAFRTRFFLSKQLYEQIAIGRFANGMALTLSSGLDTDESLHMVSSLTDHPVIQEKIKACEQSIAEGEGFSDAIRSADIFTGVQNRMISIGIKTGSMEQVMAQIAEQCDTAAENRINRLLSVLEPTLVAVLAVIVGFILLSVMLPLISIMSNIGA